MFRIRIDGWMDRIHDFFWGAHAATPAAGDARNMPEKVGKPWKFMYKQQPKKP